MEATKYMSGLPGKLMNDTKPGEIPSTVVVDDLIDQSFYIHPKLF